MHQALPYKSLFQPSTATTAPTNFPTARPLTQLPFPGQLVLGAHHARNNGGEEINHDETVDIKSKVSQNPVIVIGRRGCCMTHVVKRLLLTLGVNPALHEMADDEEEEAVSNHLRMLVMSMSSSAGLGDGGDRLQFPAVFIGGKLFGGLDRVMATHISGELTPLLKEAGALWL